MYQPKNKAFRNSHISSLDQYKTLYEDSIKSPEILRENQAQFSITVEYMQVDYFLMMGI